MKRIGRWLIVLGMLLLAAGCEVGPQAASQSPEAPKAAAKTRGPAVAGLFYPRSEEKLGEQLDKLLGAVKAEPVGNLRALICPHAGYEFSGPTAAVAYKQLVGREIRTVFVLGPSHHARFDGAYVPEADAFETPLGNVPVSAKAAEMAAIKPFTAKPKADVQRPPWSSKAPKELPPFGEDTPDTWEHSLEVQLPFLQRTLKNFQIIPVVYGEVDPAAVAEAMLKYLDSQTLIIASSDLCHYEPYEIANYLDRRTVKTICELGDEEIGGLQACGYGPVRTVMELARKKGWKAKLLDYRNSGDTSGEKARGVVGYAAIAFYAPEDGAATGPAGKTGERTPQQEFGAKERKILLELARESVRASVNREASPAPDRKSLPESLTQDRACFVTLTKQGQLRGCIGSIFPEEALYDAVIHKARSAALADPRFPRVRPEELKEIEVEVSVLSLPKHLNFRSPEELLKKLRPKVDGVVLRSGPYQATFLPQVWEQIPEKEDFLGRLSQKAGLSAYGWRRQGATVMVYQAEAFKEGEK